MEYTQTSIWHKEGVLIITGIGILDDKTSPPIFAEILKYTHEAPQIVICDLTKTEWVKTAFLNGLLVVQKYLEKSGWDIVIVRGDAGDVLEITGISKKVQTFDTLENALSYCRKHFPHVIDFVLTQKNKNDISTVLADVKSEEKWSFFMDEAKTIPNVNKILEYSIVTNASDIHLHTGKHITYRVEGILIPLTEEPVLTEKHIDDIKNVFLSVHPKIKNDLETQHDADFWYISEKNQVSFRVNGFWSLGKLGFSLRRIEKKAKNCEDLWLPKSIEKFIHAKQWLVLITGPTGSGKSTTLVAMLEEINNLRWDNIITIEDPIEFIFTDKKSNFSQREVGRDTHSFSTAIRAAMREDPDIVVIGEMRDAETVESALNLAETGHLVFSTLHTSWSVQTISRIIQFFTAEQQRQIYWRLADSLLGVLSQRLLMRRDGTRKRIAIFELMLLNPGIKNLIRSGDMWQMTNAIENGRAEGMIPMYLHAQELEKRGIIQKEDYEWFFTNQDI